MRRIRYVIFKRLGKTDLDVLSDAADNSGQAYLIIGRNRGWFEELVPEGLEWSAEGKSDYAQLKVAAVPAADPALPEQELTVRVQHGVRGGEVGEVRLNQQRGDEGLRAWKALITASRPDADTAYIFLICDSDGLIHARYLPELQSVPEPLRLRIEAGGSVGNLDFREEAGIVLDHPLIPKILEALRSRHNVILYGPPGTGKTWLMTRVQQAFHEGFAPVLFDPDDVAQPFKQAPGERFLEDRDEKQSAFITFHQSTAYESFVCGLRPSIDATTGQIVYGVTAGPLLELAEEAAAERGASLLLIDEINRGNTAEIFGELVTLLESDKRLGADGNARPETIEAVLPYAPEGYSVVQEGRLRLPYHLYVLASANSVDRTVAPLDSALRRRFRMIEVAPDYAYLEREAERVGHHVANSDLEEWRELADLARRLLVSINDVIAVLRGPDFQIGHAYLSEMFDDHLSMKERRARLVGAFSQKLLPQLRELFRDSPAELQMLLGGERNEGLLFEYRDGTELLDSSAVVDPIGWLRFRSDALSSSEWLEAIQGIASRARSDGNEQEKEEPEPSPDTGPGDAA